MIKQPLKHYSLLNILSKNARYNIIFGERSNGKTFAVIEYCIDEYLKSHKHHAFAIIRRWDEDLRGSNGLRVFDNFIHNEERGNIIESKTKGKYNSVKYQSRMWWLQHVNEDGEVDLIEQEPIAYALAISMAEHYKSSAYPRVMNILFDEFITRDNYIADEFVEFSNVLSTIIRNRDNVKIFMCGNTVNKYSPYFSEMGLKNVRKMNKGDIDVYEYGDSGLKVAVEYSDFPSKKKKSDVYFAFDNPKLAMITKGDWEIKSYPHKPCKFNPTNIIYFFFILFEEDILQCEVVNVKDMMFIFIHRKTTPLKDDKTSLVYQQEYDPRPNYRRKLTKPSTEIEHKIANLFMQDKVFYQDNEIGEIVRNYIIWCNTKS